MPRIRTEDDAAAGAVRLRLLGGVRLEAGGEAVRGPAAHRHPLALLALLVCAPSRALTRGRLVGLLWPEVPETTARNRLSTCVHRLRSALGEERLESAGPELRLPEWALECDVTRFRAALEADDPATAVAVYGGPFMDGFWLRGSPEFERWAGLERDRLRRGHQTALEHLAIRAEGEGDVKEAERWWREWVADDPFNPEPTLRLASLLAATNRRVEAVRVAERHVRRLSEEVGAEAGAEMRRAIERLREGDGELAVSRSGGRWGGAEEAAPSDRDLSVAVLPFEEVGREAAHAAAGFADGLHHDLLTRLSRVRSLKVISRSSVLGYVDSTTRPRIPEIARELGVDAVVEGAVQQVRGRVRLNVQLIDVHSDAHRWAETFDRELTAGSLFDIQSELAEGITGHLRRELTSDERERIMGWTPTEDIQAYRLQVQGRARLDERTAEGMRRAVEHFEAAIERDPEYALARVGLADALTLLYEYGHEPQEETLPRARAEAERAVELDPELAEGHASLGLLHDAHREGPAAIRAYQRAVDLQPSYAEAHNWLSWTNQLLGRAPEALAGAKRAVELNPLSPEAVSNLSVSYLFTGDPEQALREAERCRELQPTWDTPLFYQALALFDLERYEEAAELLRDVRVPWAGPGSETTRAMALARADRETEARQLRRQLEERGEEFAVVLVDLALGDLADPSRAIEAAVPPSTGGGPIHGKDVGGAAVVWMALALHHYYRGLLGPLREEPRYRAARARAYRAWSLEADGSFPDR